MNTSAAEVVAELRHAARHNHVAAAHEDQVVQHRAVFVPALHRVAPGLDDASLLVAEVVVLHSVEVAVLRAVPEDDDHPIVGCVARVVNIAAQSLASPAAAPEILAGVARPHEAAVHEQGVPVCDDAVTGGAVQELPTHHPHDPL